MVHLLLVFHFHQHWNCSNLLWWLALCLFNTSLGDLGRSSHIYFWKISLEINHWSIFQIGDWCGRAQPIMIGSTLDRKSWVGIKKKAGWTSKKDQVLSSMPPCRYSVSFHAFRFLSWVHASVSLGDRLWCRTES